MKENAKKVLFKNFENGVDYQIHPNEKILLNIQAFKEFLIIANTEECRIIRKYYFSMERILNIHVKEQLAQKNKELEYYHTKTYEEVEKLEHVYVLSTDKDGIYKIGRTKDVPSRKRSLQTACIDDIDTLLDFPTNKSKILEDSVHHVIDHYRCKSNREHFRCNLNYVKAIIEILGTCLDTCKSTFDTMSKREIIQKIGENFGQHIPVQEKTIIENQKIIENCNEIELWLNNNIAYEEGSLLYLSRVAESFFNHEQVHVSLTSKFKNEIQNYIKKKYPNEDFLYQDKSWKNIKYKGWRNFKLLTFLCNDEVQLWLSKNTIYTPGSFMKQHDLNTRYFSSVDNEQNRRIISCFTIQVETYIQKNSH